MAVAQRQTNSIHRRVLKAPGIPNYRLKELRLNKGWSRELLGYKAGGISHVTIKAIEEGHTLQPQARTMFQLANALDTTVADLERKTSIKDRA